MQKLAVAFRLEHTAPVQSGFSTRKDQNTDLQNPLLRSQGRLSSSSLLVPGRVGSRTGLQRRRRREAPLQPHRAPCPAAACPGRRAGLGPALEFAGSFKAPGLDRGFWRFSESVSSRTGLFGTGRPPSQATGTDPPDRPPAGLCCLWRSPYFKTGVLHQEGTGQDFEAAPFLETADVRRSKTCPTDFSEIQGVENEFTCQKSGETSFLSRQEQNSFFDFRKHQLAFLIPSQFGSYISSPYITRTHLPSGSLESHIQLNIVSGEKRKTWAWNPPFPSPCAE
ncbi:hypothetical protein GW7_17414 [Heterocephalus glaber]|uniref:Uncharacterized protein n=1 Tax=Heterocephalus glaber TaxID=10181 RepID=G5AVI2_HETGA|nr:hypothetical protein GW7_17414 [Heterocephalus glaber]